MRLANCGCGESSVTTTVEAFFATMPNELTSLSVPALIVSAFLMPD